MTNRLYLALLLIKRDFGRFLILFVLIFVVTLVASVFLFGSSSLRFVLTSNLAAQPDITVQKLQGGRIVPIERERLDELLEITGVSEGDGRIWGYYYFESAGINLTLVGRPNYTRLYHTNLDLIPPSQGALTSQRVKELFMRYTGKEAITLIHQQQAHHFPITDLIPKEALLESIDMIILPSNSVRMLLELPNDRFTDIVLWAPNPLEHDLIAQKILALYPDSKVMTKEGLRRAYQQLFDHTNGIFLLLFIILLTTLLLLVLERASGLDAKERHEIGLLRAIGYSADEIIWLKLLSYTIPLMFAFLGGVASAYAYLYVLGAPLLQQIIIGASRFAPQLELPPVFEIADFGALCLMICVPYLLVLVWPLWQKSHAGIEETLQ